MEATTAAIDDTLIDELDFKLKPGASYITGRRNCSFFSMGGNEYSPQGVRVLRFQLASDGWLDPSSVRIMYTLKNNDNAAFHYLRPLSGPPTFFQRFRCIAGGTVIEDCSNWDRLSHMFQILSTDEYTKDSQTEGFGFPIYRDGMPIKGGDFERGIPPGGQKTVLFKPLSGLLMQSKLIPMRYCPITIELELVNNFADPIVSEDTANSGPSGNPKEFAIAGAGDINAERINFSIPAGTFSTDWTIYDAQLKCDIVSVDSGLENSYSQYLLDGKHIPIRMQTFVSQSQALAQSSQESINISRSFTRLKALYITFLGKKTGDLRQEYLKTCNNFYSPLCGSFSNKEIVSMTHFNTTRPVFHSSGFNQNGNVISAAELIYERSYIRNYDAVNELWWQIQLGSKLYPEYMCKSNSESWYHLAKTLKFQNKRDAGLEIEPHAYYNHEYIIGQNLERVEGASFTGINTKMGDLLTIRLNNQSADATHRPNKIFIAMIADQIVNISDTGVQVFD